MMSRAAWGNHRDYLGVLGLFHVLSERNAYVRPKLYDNFFLEDDYFLANEECSCQEECTENGAFCALGQVILIKNII